MTAKATRRKKWPEVPFSAYERRVLEIPQRDPQHGPEAEALRKMIDTMPWLLIIADCRFDRAVADAVVYSRFLKIQSDNVLDHAIEKYKGKK